MQNEQKQNERDNLRALVRGAYDLQKLRIQMGNRIVANAKVKLGQDPGEKEDQIDKEGKEILQALRQYYDRLADGLTSVTRVQIDGDGVISTYAEFALVRSYVQSEAAESDQFKLLKKSLDAFPIWTEWLTDVCGVGPAMAGVIISEIDIAAAKYASSIWAYAGLDVAADGAGRSRRKEHLVEREYKDKKGETQTRVGITFNPFLKTKLVGVLGSSFIKQPADRCPYRGVYDEYKHRLECHPKHQEKTKGHRHNMAVRYMVKRFIVDLYAQWRGLEGLPVEPEYSEAKLGHVHAA